MARNRTGEYVSRRTRGESAGFSVSQQRGHPRKGELSITRERALRHMRAELESATTRGETQLGRPDQVSVHRSMFFSLPMPEARRIVKLLADELQELARRDALARFDDSWYFYH